MKMKMRRIILCLMVAILFINIPFNACAATVQGEVEKDSDKTVFVGENYEVEFVIESSWDKGYNANVIITNTGDTDIHNWMIKLDSSNNILNVWNGEIFEKTDGAYKIKNVGWNQDIYIGESVTFGYTASYEENICVPQSYELLGIEKVTEEGKYEIQSVVNSEWNDGYTVDLFIKNLSDKPIEDWKISFDMNSGIKEIWNGVIISEGEGKYTIGNNEYNGNIASEGVVTIGFKVDAPNGEMIYPENFVLSEIIESEVPSEEIDPEIDTDGDGLTDADEIILSTDKDKVDTDGDGLSDYYEVYMTYTNPLVIDTDSNTISDADEDLDGDKLSNIEEIEVNGNPWEADTDFDELGDYEEKELGTSLEEMDTDGDGMTDSYEVKYKTNPLVKDTDGNGILDGDEKYSISQGAMGSDGTNDVEVSVEMELTGKQLDTLMILQLSEDDLFINSSMPGFISEGYQFDVDGEFDKAKMIFEYKQPEDTENYEPCIYWFNEEEQCFEEVANQTVSDNKVIAEVEHFSKYVLLNRVEFEKIWKDEIVKPNDYKKMNLALVIDASGSMKTNDKNGIRLQVANNMIDELNADDEVSIVSFATKAILQTPFTTDKKEAKTMVSDIGAEGTTALYDGIIVTSEEFTKVTDKDAYKVMVVLADGDDSASKHNRNTAIQSAKDNNITVYTVGLGKRVNKTTMQHIADETGGKYFHAEVANDLGKIFDNISGETVDYITDTDEDGICDYYEDNLTKLANGVYVKLDKENPDTDGDGILDGEEVKVYIDKYGRVYYKMISNPNSKDTDKDDIDDKTDDDSLSYNITDKTLALLAGLSYNDLQEYSGKTISEIAKLKGKLKNFDANAVKKLGNAYVVGGVKGNASKYGLGYVAVIFPQYKKTPKMVIAYRGTETDELKDKITDGVTDAKLGVSFDSAQSRAAYQYYKSMASNTNFIYYLTGHSLGGRLVQDVLYKTYKNKDNVKPIHSTTYNGLGYYITMYIMLDDDILNKYKNSLNNYYYRFDLVGNDFGYSGIYVRTGTNIKLEGKDKNGNLFTETQNHSTKFHGIVYMQNDPDLK